MKEKTKTCEICRQEFTTRSPNSKYCCFSCADAARQIRRRQWADNNPQYNTNYMRQYRAAQKGITGDQEERTAAQGG